MKVCIIIPNFYPAVVYGGWVFSSLNTCRELAKLGISSYVSTTNDNGISVLPSNSRAYIEIEKDIFVKYYPQSVRDRISVKMLFLLWKDIRAAEVVHIQGIFSAPTPIGLFYANILGKKILLSPHGCMGQWCLSDGSKFKKLYLRWLIQPLAKKILWHATSLQEKEEILSLYPSAKVEIIPNGVNTAEFLHINRYTKDSFVAKYTENKKNPDHVLISMSRLHKKKGIDILIRAFYLVFQKLPKTILLIAGEDFGEKAKLDQLIKELELEENIYFVGHLQDQERIDFFGNADLFVLPSHNENFGLVFAEAMAAGTPIVASKFTPWEEVEKEKIGKWVANSPEATAEAILELLSGNLKYMGEQSKIFIEKNYSWISVGRKFKDLFEKMANI